MRIAEIYQSIQGEGLLTGAESVFVRASGCNLRCWFCDTPFASWQPEGEDVSVDEIIDRAIRLGGSHAVLTGGEPMLFSEMIPLTTGLKAAGFHVTIETAGTLYLPLECDLMSISPKLTGSGPDREQHPRWHARHEQARHEPQVIRRLIAEHPYQVKFVIDTPADCDQVAAYLAELPEIDRDRVLLMPQGTDETTLARTASWLVPYCEERQYRYCPRRQIEWFGPVRGT